jgi:hypothetical protein
VEQIDLQSLSDKQLEKLVFNPSTADDTREQAVTEYQRRINNLEIANTYENMDYSKKIGGKRCYN